MRIGARDKQDQELVKISALDDYRDEMDDIEEVSKSEKSMLPTERDKNREQGENQSQGIVPTTIV